MRDEGVPVHGCTCTVKSRREKFSDASMACTQSISATPINNRHVFGPRHQHNNTRLLNPPPFPNLSQMLTTLISEALRL